ncbi:formyl transferase [Metabacillus idriensis]|uniref:methionyl-tRNA formyltransferase n=1 Tax=Metabacillus idriensis TaxID=324768 RepID=UPI0008A9EB77|nr:formyltransferase family protein [Metabacillus idriensis]MCM3596566.1 formyl transferase [Metabacillus idriensis]OHR68139.1 formyl transferase [Bacillus sp. HMSC76G11]
MKVIVIGCVQFSCQVLKQLLSIQSSAIEIIGVITRRQSKINSDFCSLEPLANANSIPCFIAEGNNQLSMASWLQDMKPDVIYCFGWSYLLKQEILSIPKLGVIGYHPAALPQNRGRHPIIWALSLGLEQTASTFFVMDEGADSGEIISQRFVAIEKTDDAGTLYQKLTETALVQIAEFTKNFAAGTIVKCPQNDSYANYWRKRSFKDGKIDWRMSAEGIYNLVRALTRPYPGAHCMFNDREVKIWKVKIVEDSAFISSIKNLEPGKVLKFGNSANVVKCGDGAVQLIEHEFNDLLKEGSYL